MQTESVDLLITNALVVAMDDENAVLHNGALAISGSKIAALGKSSELEAKFGLHAREIMDAKDKIVMPGLVNAHTHAAMSLYRGLAEDIVLEDWLKKLQPAEHRFTTLESVYLGVQLALVEMIRSGITTALDMYWFPQAAARAAHEANFRLASGPVVFDPSGADHLTQDQRWVEGREFFEEYANDDLIIPFIQPHGTYTVAPEGLRQAWDMAERYDVGFHTHASETAAEVAMVKTQYGLSPIMHLKQLGMLTEKTILAHCVHMNEEEMEILKETGTGISHNPLSNLKLASGIAPIPQSLRKGIQVGLGTDGACSGNDLDMWKAMRFAAMVHKTQQRDPTVMPACQVLQMATIMSAKALGIADKVGSLEPGKCADIILIDLNRPHLTPLYDIYPQLIYSAGRDDVSTVIINGKIVMRDRQMTTLDEDCILAEARAFAQKIKDN
jgi:5-methylthioadenosine/S-adenosylhomocysteine deaminase